MPQHIPTINGAAKSPPYGLIVAVAARDARLSEMHFRTLIAIASYANWKRLEDIGKAWPTFATVSRDHGIAPGTLSRCTNDLANWGYWSIEQRPNRSGGRAARRYLFRRDIIDIPDDYDRAKLRVGGTSEHLELASSAQPELPSSTMPEVRTSKGRNVKREQTNRTDQTEQTQENRHNTLARLPPAAIAAGGYVRSAKNEERKPSAIRRATVIMTLDLAFDAEFAALAAERGLSDEQARIAWDKFRGHFIGKARRPEQWLGEWVKWVAREAAHPSVALAGSLIDPNMPLSPGMRNDAISIGIDESRIDETWFEFRLHHHGLAGPAARSRCWASEWKKFCVRKVENRAIYDEKFEERYY